MEEMGTFILHFGDLNHWSTVAETFRFSMKLVRAAAVEVSVDEKYL